MTKQIENVILRQDKIYVCKKINERGNDLYEKKIQILLVDIKADPNNGEICHVHEQKVSMF